MGPEELLRYGKNVIQKHHRQLFNLKNGTIPPIIDESNNQAFDYSNYRIWRSQVEKYIKEHDKDNLDEVIRLFDSFELLFTPDYLSKILGILSTSIGLDNLIFEEKVVSPDNSQTTQTTNGTNIYNNIESLPIEKNPPKEKKTIWERVWKIIGIIATIISIIAAIATIIGVVYNIFFDK